MTQDQARLLTDLAAALHEERVEEPTVRTVVLQARHVVPDAEHASITVRARRQQFLTLGSSSQTASEADALQYTLKEGPCVEAATEGGWLRSGDVSTDPRWPRWGPEAGRLGVRSLLSVRLISRGEPFGAINLYSTVDGRFHDADEVDRALLWTTHVTNALTAAQQVSGLETALASRHLIGMAQGIVMQQFGLTEDQSFSLLCRLSSHRNEKLRVVAADIVRTGKLPSSRKAR